MAVLVEVARRDGLHVLTEEIVGRREVRGAVVHQDGSPVASVANDREVERPVRVEVRHVDVSRDPEDRRFRVGREGAVALPPHHQDLSRGVPDVDRDHDVDEAVVVEVGDRDPLRIVETAVEGDLVDVVGVEVGRLRPRGQRHRDEEEKDTREIRSCCHDQPPLHASPISLGSMVIERSGGDKRNRYPVASTCGTSGNRLASMPRRRIPEGPNPCHPSTHPNPIPTMSSPRRVERSSNHPWNRPADPGRVNRRPARVPAM